MKPYAKLVVLEIGGGAATAYAGKLFADLGATVVRVEPPGGDALRSHQSFDHEAGTTQPSQWAAYLFAGKQSVVADVASASSSETVRKLVDRADIVFHGLLGQASVPELAIDRLCADFPAVVIVSVSPYGMGGQWETCPADDLALQALSGISMGIGEPGRAPLKLPGDQSAYQAGLAAAVAAAGQIFSGTGALLDVSAADVWASFYNGGEIANDYFGRKRLPRAGYQVARQPYVKAIFPCKDGYFAVQCLESRQWQAFLTMLGDESYLTDPMFVNRAKASDQEVDACNARIAPWFRVRTKEEILLLCLEHRIPGAPVYNVSDVVKHPHLEGRGYFSEVATEAGAVTAPTHPFGGLAEELKSGRKMPRIGECQTPLAASTAKQRRPFRFGTADLPLAGLRVADFGWVWAGAIPGHILADLGAEVIKIESRSPLDFMRQGRPLVGTAKDPEQNPVFQNVNRGKKSLCINLQQPGAAEVVKELVAQCDVVIDNFAPGVMAKFGLAWDDLVAIRPDLVMCSMSAVGQNGPLRNIRTYAVMIGALSGLNSIVGYPGEHVIAVQAPPYADPNAGIHAAFGILAALWHREQSGKGGYIDLSQWEAAVNVMGHEVTRYITTGSVTLTCGTQQEPFAPFGHYPVIGTDKWISISVRTDVHWGALEQALDAPAWMADPRFRTAASRLKHRTELDCLLAEETVRRDGAELSAKLHSSGIPSFPLLDIGDIRNHPYFLSRQLFQMVDHPVLNSVPVYRLPWQRNGNPILIRRRAPYLGEHTEEILQGLLKKSSADITQLRATGVLQ